MNWENISDAQWAKFTNKEKSNLVDKSLFSFIILKGKVNQLHIADQDYSKIDYSGDKPRVSFAYNFNGNIVELATVIIDR